MIATFRPLACNKMSIAASYAGMSDIKPILYVKTGCPWCREATDTLNEYDIAYEEVVVSGNSEAMTAMVELSGQSKAPTMDWNGEVLADFGAEELVPFLKARGIG